MPPDRMDAIFGRLRALRVAIGERYLTPPVIRRVRFVLVAAVIALLVYQLSRIGWSEFLTSLPATPLFYLLFLCLYFTLPLTETVIYRSLWSLGLGQTLAAMLRKRVYNKDVMGYSGEVFLALWAARATGRPRRRIVAEIKDCFLLSVGTMTIWAVGLLGALLVTGQIALLPEGFGENEHVLLYAVVAIVILAAAVVIARFRRAIFVLPTPTLLRIGSLHAFRVVAVCVMQVAQWMVVMPSVSLQTWLTFLAIQIVISRIPILPSRDLIFAGVGIEISRLLSVPPAPVAGMLLASSVLDKLLNFVMFASLSRADRDPPNEGDNAVAVEPAS